MKTTVKNSNLTILAAAALAAVVLTTNPARAGIEVTPDHIQGTPTFAVQGTLLAIDEPSSMDTTTTFINGPAGPDWTDDADDGFSVLTGAQIAINEWRAGMWEPDGTPDTGDNVSYMFNKPGKSVTWAFDLPDGSIVHNVWATWFHQGNSGTGHTYTVDEGTPMTFTKTAAAGSTGNLVLQWTAADASVYNSNYQRIFAGPIVVAGGDGFKVTFTQVQNGVYPYIDAVVVDYTIPSADPPVIAALSPADDATGVVRNANLVATFDKAVVLTGTGTVTIRNKTLGTDQVITLPDAQVSVSALAVTINPAALLAANTDYAVMISDNAVEDLNGTDFAGILDDTTWNFTTTTDGTPPALASTDPTDGATDVWTYANLVATFDEPVKLTGTGSVTIRNLSPAEDLTINLPNSQVSVSDTQLTINLSGRLATGTDYAVRIGSDAVEDLNGNPFAGIPDDTTWNFTTVVDNTPPEITSTIPADDATGVAPYDNLVAAFSENVQLTGSGTVTIRNVSLGTQSTITLPNAQVSVSGTQLTIDLTSYLASGTDYAVQISGNAVEDVNGNAFAGIADDTTWNFTTAPTPSGGYEVTPDHIVTGSATGTLLAVDVPFNSSTESVPVFGGPDWPENADDGFTAPIAAGDGLRGLDGASSNWEPDGTPLAQAKGYFTFGDGPAPSVSWSFGLPDGAVINAVYATWNTRGTDGITYQYSEGAASGSIIRQTGGTAPAANLVLSWTDAASGIHQGNFERIFTGPITVEGGNGFTLWGTDNIGNAAHIDAVILDISSATVGYANWSGGAASDIDTNGDGVENGVAWALGAADPNANAIGLLPALDNTTDPAYLLFTFNRSDEANDDPNTAITVEYGNDLVGWTTAVDDNDNVEIEVTDGTPTDAVVVKLKRSTLGATGRIFARLKVVVTP